jgi:hypothetical protein
VEEIQTFEHKNFSSSSFRLSEVIGYAHISKDYYTSGTLIKE